MNIGHRTFDLTVRFQGVEDLLEGIAFEGDLVNADMAARQVERRAGQGYLFYPSEFQTELKTTQRETTPLRRLLKFAKRLAR